LPRHPAAPPTTKKDIRPDFERKGDTLCFTAVKILLEELDEGGIGWFHEREYTLIMKFPYLLYSRALTPLLHDLAPDRVGYYNR